MQDTELSEQKILTEHGRVVSIEGEFAYVQVDAKGGCNGCASASSCGTSSLAEYFKGGTRGLIKVKNSVNAHKDDRVLLILDQSQLVKQAFMAYGMPLLGLFVFALLFQWIGASLFEWSSHLQNILAIIGGFMGVGLGWLFTYKRYQPVLPEITLLNMQ
ncbi:hypothetical protein MNBD_GAMMA04-146 [hydrothermal vent metagenome]|uniref:Sigma factor RpoE regulatory protein RseC n=1 Tax=hydrothermal vent metagenome TaxID=652676 RepID=A0A3B0W0B6_9ZZZZ